MKFLKSKFCLISVCVVAILVLGTALFSVLGWTGPLRSVAQTVAKPFTWCGARIADAVNGFADTFTEYDRLKEENESLRAEVEALKGGEYEAELLQEENAWLKEYLKLATDHPELSLTDARIIARESDNYSTVLTLDRGSVHGVKAEMPVVTDRGVFGYVKEVGLDWCRVVSIVETASSAGAYTDRGGVLGIVEGDPDLRGGGTCRMTYIENTADIRIGDRVYTAGGKGSLYPPGLLIGEVVSITADEYTHTLVAEVRPAVDFTAVDELSRVMILTGYGTEG